MPASIRFLRQGLLALAVGLAIAAANFFAWQLLQQQLVAPDHTAGLAGISYNGAGRWQSPAQGGQPTAAELEQDLALLARHTRRIRSYSAADQPLLPAVARRHGLELMLGAWLDDRLDGNRRELSAALDQARAHPNVRRLIVGNETQLKAKLPPNRLIAYLEEARAALQGSGVQVSTAEPWHVWLAQPQLAQHVDFVTIHVLPYWERESVDTAVRTGLAQIARVKARFPGKPVVVGEIGWPSNGPPLGRARATPADQALFLRHFLTQARAAGLDYYVIEAFDQPWKIASEGRAGAYWGLWDSWRRPKFEWSGPVLQDPHGPRKAAIASGLGLLAVLLFWPAAPAMRLPGRITFGVAAQGIVSLGVVLLSIPLSHYLTAPDLAGLVLVAAALAFIGISLATQAFEFADRFWAPLPAGPVGTAPSPPCPTTGQTTGPEPFVSVHLACANEPPAMVLETVDSLLALDWPAFEVIVVDNNTTDAAARQALADGMARRRHPRLRFAQFERLPGFKAGALNQALDMTDPAAQWVAVVDADYVVDPAWFRSVQTHFQNPAVGVVQAPQAHRLWEQRAIDRMMNWETEGFFRIGMHHRHARNAIIQHGTMTVVRATELRRLRWNEACVCEDTELGLRLLQGGWRAEYVDRRLGEGLLPRDFDAYARQRRRWACGAMQILRLHARALLGRSGMSLAQRYHFLAGWLPWLGDALHGLFSVVMIAFSLGMAFLPDRVEPPLWLFVVPLFAFFCARLLIGPALYVRCVPCGWLDRLGAAMAGMALSHRIARGVLQGLRGGLAVFEITRKAAATAAPAPPTAATPEASGVRFVKGIEEEFALLTGLVFCAALLALSRDAADSSRLGWIVVLAVQSLPYWAALCCRLIELRAPADGTRVARPGAPTPLAPGRSSMARPWSASRDLD